MFMFNTVIAKGLSLGMSRCLALAVPRCGPEQKAFRASGSTPYMPKDLFSSSLAALK